MTRTVRGAASISLPIEVCWQNLRDLTRAKHYVPGLSDTVITTEAKEGVGASRIVTHRQFGEMNETVVEWDERCGMTFRLHKGDKPATPFKEAFFRYELRPAAASEDAARACVIHTSLRYELPFGFLGRLADRAFMGRMFRQNVIDCAVCLAEYYETGEPVPASEIPRLRANSLV
jgi:hypothetical protein